ncbi:MAG: penicillin-binding transpeptidase domain-containing protein, partial [Deltaproteobacteria bacterium]|nr:penicillin-binding transpeptidase domain-containing protein [Deltaproteobacteria bacterium]
AKTLEKYLRMDYSEIATLLNQHRNYAVVAKGINPQLAKAIVKHINKPRIIGYHPSELRKIHCSDYLLPLIGRVSWNGKGAFGLELYFDKSLQTDNNKPSKHNDGLYLTIDTELQDITDQILQRSFKVLQPDRLLAVIANPRTGDILAYSQIEKKARPVPQLLLTEFVFEPGSIFKVFTLALMLENKITTPDEKLYCENGSFKIGGHLVEDVHPYGMLTTTEVFSKSSNICMGKLALRLNKHDYMDGIRKFGFGRRVLNFSGESNGILFNPVSLKSVDAFVMSYGHGIAVTPIQLLQAFTAFFNQGRMIKPKVSTDSQLGTLQVVSASTAHEIKKMLVDAVINGTGKHAKVTEVVTGGKTGTAIKIRHGGKGYLEKSYVSSFLGFAEFDSGRQMIILIIVDEPRGGKYLAGETAAPVFRQIVEKIKDFRLYERLLNPTKDNLSETDENPLKDT